MLKETKKYQYIILILSILCFLIYLPVHHHWEYSLKTTLSLFDEGLLLTLRRFTSLDTLLYRDLWSLYGPTTIPFGKIIDAIFGISLIPHRVLNIVFLAGWGIASFKLFRRFVSVAYSAVFTLAIVLIAIPLPYLFTFLCLTLFLYFFTDENGISKKYQNQVFAMLALGASVLGRYEYMILVPVLLAVIWFQVYRPVFVGKKQLTLLALGMAPTILFLLYIYLLVPPDTAYENFIQYPFKYYAECSGGIETLEGLKHFYLKLMTYPFGGMFQKQRVLTYFGSILLPLFIILNAVNILKKKFDPLLIISCGIGGFVFLANTTGKQILWPESAIFLTLLCIVIFMKSIKLAYLKNMIGGIAVFFSLMLVITFYVQEHQLKKIWLEWPSFDKRIGFYANDPNLILYPERLKKMEKIVNTYTNKNDKIFIALDENSTHLANAAALYWIFDRKPITNYYEFDPGLTDRNEIQEKIVEQSADLKLIIVSNFFKTDVYLSKFEEKPANVLDDFIEREFNLVEEFKFSDGLFYRIYIRKEYL